MRADDNIQYTYEYNIARYFSILRIKFVLTCNVVVRHTNSIVYGAINEKQMITLFMHSFFFAPFQHLSIISLSTLRSNGKYNML